VVQAGQRGEPLARDVQGVVHRDQGVRVCRVARHSDAYVVGGVGVEGLALDGEDGAVGLQQVAPLHALGPRPGPDEQGQVDAVEDRVRVVADLDAGKHREGAVFELHDHPFERLQGGRDLQQPQLDGRVGTQERSAGDAKQQAVADLAGSAGDGDLDGGTHDWLLVQGLMSGTRDW
jgi:hypothetical protein